MTRKSALLLLLLGIVLFFGSCAPLGYVLYREAFSEPIARIPVARDTATRSGPVEVSPGVLARIGIQGDVETQSVQEDSSGIETRYQPRFRFPLSYTVTDTAGPILATENAVLAWDGAATTQTEEEVDSHGGRLAAQRNFDKFTAPASGTILIEFSIEPDSTYQAVLSNPQLLVFDGLIDNTIYVMPGLGMLLAGLVSAIVGFVFTVSSVAAASGPAFMQSAAQPAAAARVAIEVSQRRASLIHLSGLLGYFFPLGNVIAPVVLWLSWRDSDSFVDSAGREAVNFQLSVVLYYFISILLVILIIGFLLLVATAIFHLAFMIIAAVRASHGEEFRYPMIIRFIR